MAGFLVAAVAVGGVSGKHILLGVRRGDVGARNARRPVRRAARCGDCWPRRCAAAALIAADLGWQTSVGPVAGLRADGRLDRRHRQRVQPDGQPRRRVQHCWLRVRSRDRNARRDPRPVGASPGLAFALAGACAGFLPWNLAGPAKIFLGDGGSMPIGFLRRRAVDGASARDLPRRRRGSILAGALLAGLPILDTALVSVSRLRRGVTLVTGGRDHLTSSAAARLLALADARRRVLAGVPGVALRARDRRRSARDRSAGCDSPAVAVVARCCGDRDARQPRAGDRRDRGGGAEVAAPEPASALAPTSRAGRRAVGRRRLRVSPDERAGTTTPVRVVRIIARLNIGGPAIQAITLTQRLAELGYATTLVRGREEPDEGNMDHLADELGVQPVLVPRCGATPAWHDLAALVALIRIIRRERPQIVHTHAAKGGTLGRLAALIAFPRQARRPVLIHTFHGHSLTGYFSPRTAAVYRRIEHLLARFTDRLIAVSDEVRDELVAMRVAPAIEVRGRAARASTCRRSPSNGPGARSSCGRAAGGARHPGGRAGRDADRAARADQARRPVPARRERAARSAGRPLPDRRRRRAAGFAAGVRRRGSRSAIGSCGRASGATCRRSASRAMSSCRPPTTRARR